MALAVRRIVTGHNSSGRAVFSSDEILSAQRLGVQIWSTDRSPADNTDATDGAERAIAITSPGGSAIRVMSIEPGHRSPMHRTLSIDYGIVLEGELDLELDDGATKHLFAGDIVVQRGTMHAWINNGTQPCKIAFILLEALPLVIHGKALDPTHA